MNKYPIYIQDEEMACGAYCILMLLRYYGYKEEISEIKKKARLNQNGISMKGMLECLKAYQIEAKAYQASLEDIREHVELPCILFTIEEGIGHYVVLYEIKDDEYIIGDPAQGLISYFEDEMNEHYAQRMISIQHIGRVPELHYQSFHQFLYEIFQNYRSQILSLMMKGMSVSIFAYLSSYFYQFFIDDIQQDTHLFYMLALCIAYGIIEITRATLAKTKNQQTIHLQKAIDEDLVFQTSMNLFSLPYTFFYLDKGQIQSQITSFYQLSEISIEYFGMVFMNGCMLVIFVLGMLWIQPLLTLFVFIMFLMIFLFSQRIFKQIQDLYKTYLEAHFRYQHHLLELIDNQFLMRRYDLIQSTRERSYHLFLDESLSKEAQALKLNDFQHKIQICVYFTMVIVLGVGLFFFQQKQLSLGKLLMFSMLMSYCMDPLLGLISIFSEYKQTHLIFDKYKAFQASETKETSDLHEKITSIRFDDVGYAYGYAKPLFEHVDLQIDRHLLLKGDTGSGKSTLLKLLMGFDSHYRGHIYLNQYELSDISLSSLYKHIGYVGELPTFLHLSLRDNFLCHDEEKIKKFLEIFQCQDLIDLFHVILDEDGSPLSLGQRQIVALIRMLCQDYEICIFDEAFSHMDAKLSQRVQKYLYSHDQGKIYIMVNHQTKVVKKNWDCAIIDSGKLIKKV